MLPITISLLTALYFIGPDFVSRYILGFVVPRRTVQQTKSEEIARAVLTALIPLALAIIWIKCRHVVTWSVTKNDLQAVFSGLFSDKIFESDPPKFFAAAKAASWANWSLVWRLYTLLLIYAIGVDVLIWKYGSIRNSRWFSNHPLARKYLATFVLPRISEWHILLTIFSHKKTTRVSADILTKTDALYRGTIQEPFLAPDGSLSGLLISDPFRYDRLRFLKDRDAGKTLDKEQYWKTIPSNTFFIMASDISTVNLRRYDPVDTELVKRIQEILDGKKLTAIPSRYTSPQADKQSDDPNAGTTRHASNGPL